MDISITLGSDQPTASLILNANELDLFRRIIDYSIGEPIPLMMPLQKEEIAFLDNASKKLARIQKFISIG